MVVELQKAEGVAEAGREGNGGLRRRGEKGGNIGKGQGGRGGEEKGMGDGWEAESYSKTAVQDLLP